MLPNMKTFANDWIEAWNSHDLERILAHYTDDFEITTPMIKVALGVDSGTLKGKGTVKRYWQAALQKVPDLRFELIETTQSVESIAVYYKAVMNKRAIEVMFFDDAGKVMRAIVHYT
jgi:ketosteroid isomerase-like protein